MKQLYFNLEISLKNTETIANVKVQRLNVIVMNGPTLGY